MSKFVTLCVAAAAMAISSASAQTPGPQTSTVIVTPRCDPWPSCALVPGRGEPGGGGGASTTRVPLPGDLGPIRDYRSLGPQR